MARAKIFWSEGCQMVRMPGDIRFPGSEVRIRRRSSAVILEPLETSPNDWAWLDAITGKLDEDFLNAVKEGRPKADDR